MKLTAEELYKLGEKAGEGMGLVWTDFGHQPDSTKLFYKTWARLLTEYIENNEEAV